MNNELAQIPPQTTLIFPKCQYQKECGMETEDCGIMNCSFVIGMENYYDRIVKERKARESCPQNQYVLAGDKKKKCLLTGNINPGRNGGLAYSLCDFSGEDYKNCQRLLHAQQQEAIQRHV